MIKKPVRSLERFRVAADITPTSSRLLTRDAFGPLDGRILAFDQSFNACGWTVLDGSPSGHLKFSEAGTITVPVGDFKGGEQDLDRAQWLALTVTDLMMEVGPLRVLYETPPKGPMIRNPEVSLVTALAIRLAAWHLLIPAEGVHAKAGKRLMTGNPDAEKKEAHARLKEQDPEVLANLKVLTNESKRDAALVALAWLAAKA